MPEQPLLVSLEATDHRPDQFTLIFNSSHYSITLNPETNVTFSEWLRRLQPVLTGQSDPAGEVAPQELLHDVGTWLWQALLPDGAPAQERDSLAQALRKGRTPLLLALPDALAGLPWELLCDPQQPAEQGFLALRRPFMRLVATDTSTAPMTPPLRVLLLISSPPGLGEDSGSGTFLVMDELAVGGRIKDQREKLSSIIPGVPQNRVLFITAWPSCRIAGPFF